MFHPELTQDYWSRQTKPTFSCPHPQNTQGKKFGFSQLPTIHHLLPSASHPPSITQPQERLA